MTTLPPSYAVVMKSGNLNFLEPSGELGPVMGLFTFTLASTLHGVISLVSILKNVFPWIRSC